MTRKKPPKPDGPPQPAKKRAPATAKTILDKAPPPVASDNINPDDNPNYKSRGNLIVEIGSDGKTNLSREFEEPKTGAEIEAARAVSATHEEITATARATSGYGDSQPLQQVETRKPVSSELTKFLEHQHQRFDAVAARIQRDIPVNEVQDGFDPEIQRAVDTQEFDQAIGELSNQGNTLHALSQAQAERDAAEGERPPQWPTLASYDKISMSEPATVDVIIPITMVNGETVDVDKTTQAVKDILEGNAPNEGLPTETGSLALADFSRNVDTMRVSEQTSEEFADEVNQSLVGLRDRAVAEHESQQLEAIQDADEPSTVPEALLLAPPAAPAVDPNIKVPDQEQIEYSKKLVVEMKNIAADFVGKDLTNGDDKTSFTMRIGLEFNMWVLDGCVRWPFLNESNPDYAMNYEVRDGRMKVWFGDKLKNYFFKGKVNADGSTWD